MGAMELTMDQGEMLRLEVREGDRLSVREGKLWVTQCKDPNDHVLKAGDAMVLNGEGVTLAKAIQPTLLDLYRQDATALRQRVERESRAAQREVFAAFFRRLFAWAASGRRQRSRTA